MTATYENHGITFLYPENWKLTQEQCTERPYEVSVQSPGSGFWSVHVYEESSDPGELVAEALRSMRQEYENIDSEPVVTMIGHLDAAGYELNFYCLDFLVTARIIGFRNAGCTYLVLYQAESSEFEDLGRVFEALTISLVREKTDRAGL